MVTTPPESPSPNTSPAQRGSLRTHVVDVLELLEVPVPRHLLQDVLACRGVTVDLRQLSNLRRAEERAFRTVPTETDRLLVPAISTLDLCAIPATFTCSTWPLEQRVVGTYTQRTRHLRVLLRLLDFPTQFDSERHQRLVARYAETVRGALERGRLRDTQQVGSAAQAELDLIGLLDLEERRAAAARLAALAPRFQLWGQPALLGTSTAAANINDATAVQP